MPNDALYPCMEEGGAGYRSPSSESRIVWDSNRCVDKVSVKQPRENVLLRGSDRDAKSVCELCAARHSISIRS